MLRTKRIVLNNVLSLSHLILDRISLGRFILARFILVFGICIGIAACSSSGDEMLIDSCGSTHSNVGKTVDFEGFFHSVSGKLTVLNDCTLEVTEFNYDGQGPLVYFYAGQARRYSTDSAFAIGDLLPTGTVYENASISLPLPEGRTLDDFDSLSVWCVDFSANFGDAYFGPGL